MSVAPRPLPDLPRNVAGQDPLVLRYAIGGDTKAIEQLIRDSARVLCAVDYTPAQIDRALGTAWAVDPRLIEDGTYFVVENGDAAEGGAGLLACGGWSARSTLFGGDRVGAVRDDSWLDPARDAARVRAFFVAPQASRKGLGRLLLEASEDAAWQAGFRRTALVATLTGVRLYERFGYVAGPAIEHPLGEDGATIRFVPMEKTLVP